MSETSNAPSTKRRKFWGWGFEGEGLSRGDAKALAASIAKRYGVEEVSPQNPPAAHDIELQASRVTIPSNLSHILTDDHYERLLHSYGRSFPDQIRIFQRSYDHPPDVVAHPETEQDVVDLLEWADGAGVAVVPFGGGTSVCGGVEPAVGDSYSGTCSIDLGKLDRVLEVDKLSRAARIQGGARGPVFEAQLKEHGLTLRHFPQSFEFATLGGMIATRSGGHFATNYTHIDDFVEATRSVTPQGILETRRLPGSGAGPSPDRMMIGSEGILGIITEAWLRLQDRPTFRASKACQFDSFGAGAEAVRALSQSGLFPANCRLIDANEAANTGAGSGKEALLVLAFESADHPVEPWLERALELVADHGGRFATDSGGESEHRSGAAGQWRTSFINAPYYREVMVPLGVISDTFETAITWDRFEDFHRTISSRMSSVIEEITGRPGSVTCRFTHTYPDGPAPYFTFQGYGGELNSLMSQWREIKAAANEAVVSCGGTVTHHHAVGRDHRPGGYDQQRPELFARSLAAAKKALDPSGILNPGVLIDPVDREVDVTGAMA